MRDITDMRRLEEKYHNNGIVVGLLQLDNYSEYQQYEDETVMSNINTRIRQPLFEWAREMGMFTAVCAVTGSWCCWMSRSMNR